MCDETQEELLSLKRIHAHNLHLKKAPAGTPSAPFPISVSYVVEPTAAAEAYDVSSIKVQYAVVCTAHLIVNLSLCCCL